jgi:hypothetical protein
MKRMKHKTKIYTTVTMAFLTLSIILASISMAYAAGAITLTPTTQAPTASVTVDGTSFGATKIVGIGLGAEVAVTGEVTPLLTGGGTDGTGPWVGHIAHYPIKPGSFSMQSDVSGVVGDYTDNGDGTLAGTSAYFVSGTINYANGTFSRTSTTDLSSYAETFIHTVAYTYYAYNVTPAAGVTTGGSGTFSASITVPSVADGSYVVTAVDSAGNKATSNLTVDHTVPEGLTVGVMLALSTIAVIVSTRYFRKQPKIKNYN